MRKQLLGIALALSIAIPIILPSSLRGARLPDPEVPYTLAIHLLSLARPQFEADLNQVITEEFLISRYELCEATVTYQGQDPDGNNIYRVVYMDSLVLLDDQDL